MKLGLREKWILAIGGIAAAVIVLGGHFVLPLARTWSQMGDRLDPKLEYVGELRGRVQGHNSLLARRDALARQMGSLCGLESTAPDHASGKPNPETSETKSDAETEPPEDGEAQTEDKDVPDDGPVAPDPADSTVGEGEDAPGSDAPEPAPADRRTAGGVGLAAHLERVAQQSGVKIKRISPKKRRAGQRARKSFTPVVLQLSIESDIEGLLKTLHAIEKGDRFVRIEQFQLRRDLKTGARIDASFDVMGYEPAARQP